MCTDDDASRPRRTSRRLRSGPAVLIVVSALAGQGGSLYFPMVAGSARLINQVLGLFASTAILLLLALVAGVIIGRVTSNR